MIKCTSPTGHAGENPGGFGAEGVCGVSGVRVCQGGQKRDHFQGKTLFLVLIINLLIQMILSAC